MDMKEEISKRRKDQWIELLFSVEVLAATRNVAETSLAEHAEKIEKSPGIFVYEKKFFDTTEVKNPMKGVEVGFSRAVVMKLFIKDLFTALTAIMIYGPSSVEVLGPGKKEISMSEMQNIANNVASLVHQFAAAGAGGLVISPKRKE